MKDQSALREHLVELHRVCPGCGEPVMIIDHLHHWAHVFRRLPDAWKWHPISVILVCPVCHVPETEGLNFECAKMKLQVFGSDAIEAFVASAPTKIPITLPATYYEARMSILGF